MIKTIFIFNKQLIFTVCALIYCGTSTAMEGGEYEVGLNFLQYTLKPLIDNKDQQGIKEHLRTASATNWNHITIDPTTGNNIFHIAAATLPLVWVYGNSEHQFGIEKVQNRAGKTPHDIKKETYAQYYAKNPIIKTVQFKK